jgi:hypothetical protein
MTDGFHFMPHESHFMTEPTAVEAAGRIAQSALLNECSFSIMSETN